VVLIVIVIAIDYDCHCGADCDVRGVQSLVIRNAMFDLMVANGLGVDRSLYEETDASKMQFVNVVR
jgi:hypothetical protein